MSLFLGLGQMTIISTIIAEALKKGGVGVLYPEMHGIVPRKLFLSKKLKPDGEICIRHPQVSWLYLPRFKDLAWFWYIQQIPVKGKH